jgi:hypothetical protein
MNSPDNITISEKDVHNLYKSITSTSEESVSLSDLNKWLKSKTDNRYTIFAWQDLAAIVEELGGLKVDLETTINTLKSLKTALNVKYNLKQMD